MKISLSALALLLCSLVLPNDLRAAGSVSVRVVQVIDGDSLKVERGGRHFQVRLWGIDAPEWRQDYAARAKAVCRDLVAGKEIFLEEKYGDAYDRTVAVIRVDGTVLNEELVKRGMAWVHTRYCDEEVCTRWRDLETEARRLHIGLWNDPRPVPPWRWESQRHSEGRRYN
jgi:endonuclease YncB( thermonuclease family)